ncbi:hypothetical protein HYN24_02535 [Dechloromonas sp. HYN0024]|nr:hypothetical protein HYN24_02535 [Dechloromonas sp. HYN0024]
MLKKVANLGGFFAQKTDHPLANAREFRKVLSELPKDNAFKALDEITGWLESLEGANGFPISTMYEVLEQLEEAAQPHLKRLARDYFGTARLSRSEENRLWSINYAFSTRLAAAYERCLLAIDDKSQSGELAKTVLPSLCVRLMMALGRALKWEQFHYGPSRDTCWQSMGRALMAAEAAGVAGKAVAVPGRNGMTTPVQEYQKVMIFQAASLDSLLPVGIELAEHVIDHFLSGFVFTAEAQIDSVYWVDLKLAQPPLRLARMPAQAETTQRFMKPGSAHEAMRAVLDNLERGGDMPPEINLGGQYPVKLLVAVFRHLTNYLSPMPPQRLHDRHRVTHRMAVLNGLVNAFVVFSDEFGGRPAGLPTETWLAENVSRGGFGALLDKVPEEWLRVGALLAMQPEGGSNWLLGVVRRYHRMSENDARVGIQALATKAVALELRGRNTTASYMAAAGTSPALMLLDGNEPDEFRVILPPTTFDQRESLEYVRDGQRFQLNPVALVEQTADYELARYRRTAV